MSSAIEVLKEMQQFWFEFIELNKRNGDETSFREFQGLNALGEALLALEQKENYVIDFIRLEVLPKSKKEQFRVFFKDGTEQVFQMERVGEQK